MDSLREQPVKMASDDLQALVERVENILHESNLMCAVARDTLEGVLSALDELARVKEAAAWVPISQRLPGINMLVALADWSTYQNDPSGEYPVSRTGHLAEFGGKYWSCYGERAMNLDAFTHWLPLPTDPTALATQPETGGGDEELQPCGHPESHSTTSKDGTGYCEACSLESLDMPTQPPEGEGATG